MIQLRRNILLFHQAALGDFVLTWPIALACARLWPTNRILYVTAPSKGQLAERAIGTEYRDGESLHSLFFPEARLPEPATKLLAGAATIISFVSNGADAWADNIRRLAPEAQLLSINPRPAEPIDQHIMTWHASQLGDHPQLQAAAGQMISHIAANGATSRRAAPSDRIVIHPGSGGADKCWPAERFAELALSLRDSSHDVHVVLGEVERERMPKDVWKRLADVATVHQPADLVALFTLLQSARLYIGNDSGPTHLAAVSGVPTLALYGRDNETTWRPIGPRVRLIKQIPIDALPLEPVVSAAKEILEQASADAPPPPPDED